MSDAGGAAFNPTVRTEDNVPDHDDPRDERDETQADEGQDTEGEQGNGVR